jgi:hypothetical protein
MLLRAAFAKRSFSLTLFDLKLGYIRRTRGDRAVVTDLKVVASLVEIFPFVLIIALIKVFATHLCNKVAVRLGATSRAKLPIIVSDVE